MKTAKQQRFACLGAFFGALYLLLNHTMPGVPEFLLGLLLGLGLVCLIVGLLPGERWRALRKWKRRGE